MNFLSCCKSKLKKNLQSVDAFSDFEKCDKKPVTLLTPLFNCPIRTSNDPIYIREKIRPSYICNMHALWIFSAEIGF